VALSLLAAACAAGESLPPSVLVSRPDDEVRLRGLGLPTDGPGLVVYLRRQVPRPGDPERVAALIRRLGADSFDMREAASSSLVAFGMTARPQLCAALSDPDAEVSTRARRCLARIEHAATPEARSALLRLVARLRPPGAAEAVLDLLPTLDDPALAAEAAAAVTATGVQGDRPDPALVRALTDPHPVKRAAAGSAVARLGLPAMRAAVGRLMADPDLSVRREVALGCLEANDKGAVPVLIDLLPRLPRAEVDAVEETLYVVAAGVSPPADDGGAGARRRAAWQAWWAAHGDGVDLRAAEVSPRSYGLTLVAAVGRGGEGEVVEMDRAGRVLWRLGGLRHPVDAHVVGERVLVADSTRRTVSWWTFRGEEVWSRKVPELLLGARPLPGGGVLVITRGRVAVWDAAGHEVRAVERPQDVAAACRFRDGRLAVVTTGGRCVRYDARGREDGGFPCGVVISVGANVDALPGGHVLVPLYTRNQVAEYDAEGNITWSAPVMRPTSVHRTAGGHTLVASRSARLVVEIDGRGDEVWRRELPGPPLRAVRR
jgi:HEAT repeat protein